MCVGGVHLVGECSLAWSMGRSLFLGGERAVLSDILDTVNKRRLAQPCFAHTDARLAPCRRVHFIFFFFKESAQVKQNFPH